MAQILGPVTGLMPISKARVEEVRRHHKIFAACIETIIKRRANVQTQGVMGNQALDGNERNEGSKQSRQNDRTMMTSVIALDDLPSPEPEESNSEVSRVGNPPHVSRPGNHYKPTKAPESNGAAREQKNNMANDKFSLAESTHAPYSIKREVSTQGRSSNNMDSSEMTGNQEETDKNVRIIFLEDGRETTAHSFVKSFIKAMRNHMLPSLYQWKADNIHFEQHDRAGLFDSQAYASISSHASTNTDKPRSFSPGSTGTNPEAKTFTSSAHFSRGVQPPEVFMKQFREMQLAKMAQTGKPTLSRRRVIFKNLPDWVEFNDVMCLVYGGSIDTMTKSGEHEMSVDFIDEDTCQMYADIYKDGILICDQVITVELGETSELKEAVKTMVDEGKSRVVSIEVPDQTKFADMHELFTNYDLDHFTYSNGRAYFFLTSLTQGDELHRFFSDDRAWESSNPEFLPDPGFKTLSDLWSEDRPPELINMKNILTKELESSKNTSDVASGRR
ncbi:hypothetical protein N7478_002447 [Penicillium angulare]|uniref:uncharacterized protein n=1 Tax=Penicillium angulare TaxID=116970 RepID=UPI0025408144|nr:uncharacterized protein N7478_002447 [Penicillium angulare]KAJ5286761.1 hypothetical protein N7478_002447 [Penicillium angulare]